MIVSVTFIILGFFLLINGANFLVDGASNIAKKFHIPDLIIGLTVVSIGTSMPELFVSITSAKEGYSDMAIGNVIGSNISNIFLILGISAIIKPMTFKKETRISELPICFAVSIIFMCLCNIGQKVTRLDGIILLISFLLFIIYTVIISVKSIKEEKYAKEESSKKNKLSRNILFVLLGSVLLKVGGDLTINNAVNIANILELSEKITSIAILSIGTSLPELVTSVSVAIKGKSDIAIGNILGSNIFNMLLIIGTSAVIKPIQYNTSYNIEMIILIVATLILTLIPIMPPKDKMGRDNGFIYLVVYMAYMTSLFVKV